MEISFLKKAMLLEEGQANPYKEYCLKSYLFDLPICDAQESENQTEKTEAFLREVIQREGKCIYELDDSL